MTRSQIDFEFIERRLFGVGLPESGRGKGGSSVGIPLQAGMEEGK